MAKRKRVVKKSPSRKLSKSPKASKESKPVLKNMGKRLERSNKSLLYSLSVFVISLIFYLVTTDFLESLFGFIIVVSGALVILFGIISVILYFLNGK